ncbi:MAG: VWA domain-containing protein [Gemmataceae bacterium]|nr:VWA domain-containing protein [Gemmataceae bacterium]
MDLPQKSEFLWRRLLETPPGWVILLPVAFALLTVLMMWLFRRERGFKGVLAPLIVVGVFSAVYLALAPMLLPFASWWVVLAPMLAVALVYVGLMYISDSRSIHPAWATFLGLLRCTVYAILAVVFLLPGCQNYEQQEYHSKVLVLFDVSGSMFTIDDLPEIGQDPATLPTRQAKVLHFLTSTLDRNKKPQTAFLDRVLSKTPVTAYRWGGVLDEKFALNWKIGEPSKIDDLALWLRPDKTSIELPKGLSEAEQPKERAKLEDLYDSLLGGTNVGGSILQAAKLEAGNLLQAIVIVSDGQSNLGSDEAFREFHARVSGGKRNVPVITIGVGEYRQPASIKVEDMQAPEIARPDDKFPIRIPVIGAGLNDEEFTLTLEALRVKDNLGQPVAGEQKIVLPPRQGKFKGGGDHPRDTIEFEIDIQELKNLKVAEDQAGELEGTWEFTARVPRHPREAYPKAEHVSDPPTQVLVQKKKLRVLLFAGGPNHDYQFLRTMLFRESLENRVDLSVLLQTGRLDHVEQDVEKERLLTAFPDRLAEDPANKHMSLSEYDVIIAIDPDWRELDENQVKLLKDWVGNHAGGIVFVAGPVHTFHVARPAGIDYLTHLQTLYPVVLSDSRLPTLSLNHDPSRPYTLNFSGSAAQFDFLKLDEASNNPLAGWDEFFWGKDGPGDAAKDAKPLRGIHNFYPVDRLKPDSTVIATFNGPPSTRINNGQDEQPWLVSMRFGGGKTIFIGSAETRRLRAYSNAFHERFWIKLARFVSAGATPQKKYGRMLLARNYPAGTVSFEAQLKGKDLLPLPKDVKPTVYVKKVVAEETKPEATDLRAKATQGEWTGWFAGSVTIRDPGEYEFRIPIPGTGESIQQRTTIRRPNPELDNVRNNFALLYQLSSEAKPVIDRLPGEARREVQRHLQGPPTETATEEKDGGGRLFFTLANADAVEKCLVPVPPKTEEVKGKLDDLWDQGARPELYVNAYHLALAAPAALGLLGFAILMFLRQIAAAWAFLGGFVAVSVATFLVTVIMGLEWPTLPVHFSYVLIAVVALLSIEWLTRKLLKLA